MGRPRQQPATCTAPGCDQPTYAKQLCRGHYAYAKRHPDEPLRPLRAPDAPVLVRVSLRVTKECEAFVRARQLESRQMLERAARRLPMTAASWYKHGHFQSEDQARGAFELAYLQGLDGMGGSISEWMGLTSAEFDAWMRSGALPRLGKSGGGTSGHRKTSFKSWLKSVVNRPDEVGEFAADALNDESFPWRSGYSGMESHMMSFPLALEAFRTAYSEWSGEPVRTSNG